MLVTIAIVGLLTGTLAWFSAFGIWGDRIWFAATVPVLVALAIDIVSSLQKGEVGLDLVAALSMAAALAFGEPLAGNVVALMYSGGQLLESYAEGRARREMTALLGRVAHTAMRYAGEKLEEVPVDDIQPDERVLIRHGEVVPVDGMLASRAAILDQSSLTGESRSVEKAEQDEILSGSTNLGDAFDLVATRPAAESTYANIVRLVSQAQESKAPSVRIADRFAVWFLLLTLLIAGLAWWLSGDRIRALAVLVVATPCPLILALPVAIISGMSRSAKLGVLIKSGGALEALAKIKTAVLDKTGTLTFGQAHVIDLRVTNGWEAQDMLRLAASLDQASGHVIAKALVDDALGRGLVLSVPSNVSETAGTGVSGLVDGQHVTIGGSRYVRSNIKHGDPYDLRQGVPAESAVVAVAVNNELAGVIVLADQIRPDAALMLETFHAVGIDRIVLASGDRSDVVDAVAQKLGIDEAHGDLNPEQKVDIVRKEASKAPTMMVGDGVNDAPALATATVGVAMGARGAAASSESANVVLLVDKLDNLIKAIQSAHRTRRIALQSVLIGLGLSILAMIIAAFGLLPPVAGAFTQEVIDIAVILNALRALR
ncbi:heavy metal translocating P-type ATPase (plasmid) [Brucella anthropi]|uniref:P-type Zn(2+) transporter n=2 Tax=Brucella anthropi TaxID=529 RepID=A6X7V2_BRUA4|nr:heavy metal translocating P-type ATPase [Brucella anthropi ATCC 49188]KAB2731053.1 heavy metal translocating P-type ATPase [Brucella anthropi]QQC26926.1 heavy metal translocating P-type ATPase [Brucella anthropi]